MRGCVAAACCSRRRRDCARRGCNGCFGEGDGCTLCPATASDCRFASDILTIWGEFQAVRMGGVWGVVHFHQATTVAPLWLLFYCLAKDLWSLPPISPPGGAAVTAGLQRCFKRLWGGGREGRTEERMGGLRRREGDKSWHCSIKQTPLLEIMARSQEVFSHVSYASVFQLVLCHSPVSMTSLLCGQWYCFQNTYELLLNSGILFHLTSIIVTLYRSSNQDSKLFCSNLLMG